MSSSATSWASEVRMFWPHSILPVKTEMRLSAAMWIQAEISLGSLLASAEAARPDSCAADSG